MKKYSIGREIVASCPAAFLLTYLSLFVPGEVTGVCGDVGDGPVYCSILAYGLPLPFLADNPGISPGNKVSRNPIWILSGEDQLLLPQLLLAMLSWLLVVLGSRLIWRRCKRRRPTEN